MSLPIRLFIFFGVIVTACVAQADMVYLKNGRYLEGVIAQETDEYVELLVDTGSIKFYRREIERIGYSTGEEKKEMLRAWEKKRQERKIQLDPGSQVYNRPVVKKEKEVGVERQGDHLFVSAVLNGKVKVKLMLDTGSSLVVVSSELARQLGVDTKKDPADIEMTMANGTEVPAKLVKLNTIKVQDASACDVDAAVIYQEKAFSDFDGLLGMSFLKFFKFEINLAQAKLILQELN